MLRWTSVRCCAAAAAWWGCWPVAGFQSVGKRSWQEAGLPSVGLRRFHGVPASHPAPPPHPGPGVLRFEPGQEARRFVAVPSGATWAELKIRAGELDTPKARLWPQHVGSRPGSSCAGQLHAGALPGQQTKRLLASSVTCCGWGLAPGGYATPPPLPASPGSPLQSYMLRATALLPHTRYSDSEWRSFAQLSAHQVGGPPALLSLLFVPASLPRRLHLLWVPACSSSILEIHRNPPVLPTYILHTRTLSPSAGVWRRLCRHRRHHPGADAGAVLEQPGRRHAER